jgi:hypothetical protein
LCSNPAFSVLETQEFPLAQLLEEIDELHGAEIFIHVVLVKEDVTDVTNQARLLKQLPYPRAYGVESIVNPATEAQNYGLVLQLAGNLLWSHDHSRVERD